MKGLAFLKNVYNELLIIACYFVPEIDDVESLTFYTILYFSIVFAAYKICKCSLFSFTSSDK